MNNDYQSLKIRLVVRHVISPLRSLDRLRRNHKWLIVLIIRMVKIG